MYSSPKYFCTISMKLSEVLDDIGVNQVTVYKRRYTHLLDEKMMTIMYRPSGLSMYKFGSLSEGTTTAGLKSDMDLLTCHHQFNIIQDYSEWKPGYCNLLMIQNETTSPGYCLLQLLRDDAPLPVTHIANQHCVRVTPDQVLFKNTFHQDFKPAQDMQHGPAWAERTPPGLRDGDYVPAFLCNSWPHEAKNWLDGQKFGRWLAQDIKRYTRDNGCFVVPVGSKVSQYEALEWRISTSQAERLLMFSLNITQIRCYVLMKMILKTYLNCQSEDQISSFMCKTVLLWCIKNTDTNAWQEHNLLKCLSNCLMVLYQNLLHGNCPHFIIPGNNLMAEQFSVKTKQALLYRLQYLLQTYGQALLGIQTDDLGQRLRTKLNMIYQIKLTMPSTSKKVFILGGLLETIALSLNSLHNTILQQTDNNSEPTIQHLVKALSNIAQYDIKGSNLEQEASRLLVLPVCSSIGGIKASLNINNCNTVSQDAFDWLISGQNSDVSSGRLKLASVIYCAGNVVKTEVLLREIERSYDLLSVEPVCGCYDFSRPYMKNKFGKCGQTEGITQSVIMNTAFCVKFTRAEIYCVPQELQYEMFRSTEEDLLLRDGAFWMDWAVVDSLPYLYFLEFKTYSRLQQYDDQLQALINLLGTILTEHNLGHRETAWNLLGQCMEQINQPTNALLCYTNSLHVRQRNNAAGIHICRLLTKLVISKA